MGGPCALQSGADAPACTDNFQVIPFTFDGKEWQSCEQCYQACKSLDPAYIELIRGIRKKPGQTDSQHGNSCWDEGQKHEMLRRSDWDAVKIEIMYRVNLAKYVTNPALQPDLLSTGHENLVGAWSTGWTSAGVTHNWRTWNGLIQMRIREELRPEQDRNTQLLQSLVTQMEDYKATAGGATFPIPA